LSLTSIMAASELAKFFLTATKAINVYYQPIKKVDRETFKTFGGLVPYSGEGPFTLKNLNKLKNTIGPSQEEMLNQAENAPEEFLRAIMNSFIFMADNGLADNGQDDIVPTELQYWGSNNGLFEHLYGVMTKSQLTNVHAVLLPDGQYVLKDFSNFYDFNGVIARCDPDSKKLREEYNNLPNTAARVQWLAANKQRFMKRLYEMIEKKEFFKQGDWFLMGESIVQYKAAGWFQTTDSQGNIVKSFVMLLRPGATHPFSGWIVHGYTTGGPNSLVSWVIGGGSSKIPFLDMLNSALATRMWTITKNWSAAIADLEQRRLRNQVLGDTKLEGFVITFRLNLLKASVYFGLLVGFSWVGIWFNKLRGLRDVSSLNPQDLVQVRSLETTDISKILHYEPIGNEPFLGTTQEMKRKEIDEELQKDLTKN